MKAVGADNARLPPSSSEASLIGLAGGGAGYLPMWPAGTFPGFPVGGQVPVLVLPVTCSWRESPFSVAFTVRQAVRFEPVMLLRKV
jgi:hypothetical protein